MVTLDDPSLKHLKDPRTRLIVDMLTAKVYRPEMVAAYLESAGLTPGRYNFAAAELVWLAAVPDAAEKGCLQALVDRVTEHDIAFRRELERKLEQLSSPPGSGQAWYHHADPYTCGFVGPSASRAVIDREQLRNGLRELASGDYRTLVISGPARSGKSHSWWLVDHLRKPGNPLRSHKFVRVTTHTWSGEVTGEALIESLIDKLRLSIGLTPSGELEEARIRKLLDLLVGHYPQDDDIIRWIVLDGLDRPGVRDSARDAARRLVTLVEEGELENTRLIVTGLDTLGFSLARQIQSEQIQPMNRALLRAFFAAVAGDLGHVVTAEELDARVAEVLEDDKLVPDLEDMEGKVVDLVRKCWGDGDTR